MLLVVLLSHVQRSLKSIVLKWHSVAWSCLALHGHVEQRTVSALKSLLSSDLRQTEDILLAPLYRWESETRVLENVMTSNCPCRS